jgi:hypothetical protein
MTVHAKPLSRYPDHAQEGGFVVHQKRRMQTPRYAGESDLTRSLLAVTAIKAGQQLCLESVVIVVLEVWCDTILLGSRLLDA